MNKEIAKQFFNNLGDSCKKNSPALLIFAGLTSMAATVVMVAKVAPKANVRLQNSRDERYLQWKEEGKEDLPMTRKEKAMDIWNDFKAVAPLYAPAAVTFAVGSACIIGSYKISTARLSALTTAYGIAENRLTEYQKKVIETIGEEKEKEIQDKITKDHMRDKEKKDGLPQESLLDGTQLFFDDFSQRYFRCTLQDIYDAREWVNVTLQHDPVKLNEFYNALDMTEVDGLDIYEWAEGDKLEIRFQSHMCMDGTTTCTAIYYDVPVGRDYSYRY